MNGVKRHDLLLLWLLANGFVAAFCLLMSLLWLLLSFFVSRCGSVPVLVPVTLCFFKCCDWFVSLQLDAGCVTAGKDWVMQIRTRFPIISFWDFDLTPIDDSHCEKSMATTPPSAATIVAHSAQNNSSIFGAQNLRVCVCLCVCLTEIHIQFKHKFNLKLTPFKTRNSDKHTQFRSIDRLDRSELNRYT